MRGEEENGEAGPKEKMALLFCSLRPLCLLWLAITKPTHKIPLTHISCLLLPWLTCLDVLCCVLIRATEAGRAVKRFTVSLRVQRIWFSPVEDGNGDGLSFWVLLGYDVHRSHDRSPNCS